MFWESNPPDPFSGVSPGLKPRTVLLERRDAESICGTEQKHLASILDRISDVPALDALITGWPELPDETQSAVFSLVQDNTPEHAIQTIIVASSQNSASKG